MFAKISFDTHNLNMIHTFPCHNNTKITTMIFIVYRAFGYSLDAICLVENDDSNLKIEYCGMPACGGEKQPKT